jgi:hypothetical protein
LTLLQRLTLSRIELVNYSGFRAFNAQAREINSLNPNFNNEATMKQIAVLFSTLFAASAFAAAPAATTATPASASAQTAVAPTGAAVPTNTTASTAVKVAPKKVRHGAQKTKSHEKAAVKADTKAAVKSETTAAK